MKVFQRDRFTCKFCDYRSKKKRDIEAHHIIPLSVNIKLSLKVGNGLTLCQQCHKYTYGKELQFVRVCKEILRDYTSNIPKG